MLLIELSGNPRAVTFGPTDKFVKVYGNYCGPGNKGGEPIDAIDNACKQHDMCYHYHGRHDNDCNEKLIKELAGLLKGKLTFKQRYFAQLMLLYFKNCKRKQTHCDI